MDGKLSNDSRHGFFALREKGVVAEFAVVKEGFDGSEVCHFPGYNVCPISSTAELEGPLYNALGMFL